MQTVYLAKITQHGQECYIGKADPRILVRMAVKIEMGETQTAQRPLNQKRVKDIAKYVSDNSGILPNTLTLASKDNRIAIKPVEGIQNLYYMELPKTDTEIEQYKDAFDVMDGQHRLYSFLPDIILLDENDKYEIGFTLYIKPTIKERRQIFVSCNEKQEKVSSNLLLWFRDQLGLITGEEKRLYSIVSTLNENDPLKNHIIMSAEKIKNGVKATEIVKELQKAKILNLSIAGSPLSDDDIVKVLRTYLSAWESVVGFDFTISKAKEAGPAIKMAGLRFMIHVLPSVWDYSILTMRKFNDDFVQDTIKRMISKRGVEYERFFTDETVKSYFVDRTMTERLATECANTIKTLDAGTFNPLG